ncbi:MAG: HigA family addiction module antidote protein [Cyanobacteria bacterium TGS_CYA1]|nr:HigA family addiction module antidote protein [Cyanobacteria bacterium TGS_CYA1]
MENVHPGKILTNQFMLERGLSAYKLADCLNVGHSTVFDIVNERRGITAGMALRLGKFFKTKPEFWLELQNHYDLNRAREKLNWADDTAFDTAANAGDSSPEIDSLTKRDWKEEMRESEFINEEALEDANRVYEMLGGKPVAFDWVARDLNMTGGQVSAILTMLELADWIKRLPGDWYIRAR